MEANFIWTSWKRDQHIDYLKQKGVNELDQPLKMYGRMDNNKQLTNKKGVFLNMQEYYLANEIDPFSVLPLTYLVRNTGDQEFHKFEQEWLRIDNEIKAMTTKQNQEISKILKKSRKQRQESSDEYESDDFGGNDEEIKKIKEKYKIPLNTWIIKPGENTNRGFGINVASDINEIR